MRPPRVFVIRGCSNPGRGSERRASCRWQGPQSSNTSVLIPSSGETLSGSTYLDASATNETSVEFLLFGGTYGYSAPVVCTATATYYGWLCSWNTTDVPDGSYVLVSEASGAGGCTPLVPASASPWTTRLRAPRWCSPKRMARRSILHRPTSSTRSPRPG